MFMFEILFVIHLRAVLRSWYCIALSGDKVFLRYFIFPKQIPKHRARKSALSTAGSASALTPPPNTPEKDIQRASRTIGGIEAEFPRSVWLDRASWVSGKKMCTCEKCEKLRFISIRNLPALNRTVECLNSSHIHRAINFNFFCT